MAHEEIGENEVCLQDRVSVWGSGKKYSNAISMGAFLDGDGDIRVNEIKSQQKGAQSQSQTTTNKFQNTESESLSWGRCNL